jgi:hypothetical protein
MYGYHNRRVERGEVGYIMPHEIEARGIVTGSTGHDQGDTRLFVRAGRMQLGGKSTPRATKSLGVLSTVFLGAPAAC